MLAYASGLDCASVLLTPHRLDRPHKPNNRIKAGPTPSFGCLSRFCSMQRTASDRKPPKTMTAQSVLKLFTELSKIYCRRQVLVTEFQASRAVLTTGFCSLRKMCHPEIKQDQASRGCQSPDSLRIKFL